jgi:hypothetical protein
MATQKEVSFDEVSRELDKGMAGADALRADRLDGLTAARTIKDKRLRREQARIANKLGPTHERVTEIDGRLAINAAMIRDLKLESARAHTETPQVEKDTWLLHGYVRDKALKGVSNLTVALFDHAGSRVKGLSHGCTSSNGYFRIASRIGSGSAGSAYIRVLSQDGSLLYAGNSPLRPAAGSIDYREIILSGEAVVCPPPPIEPPVEPPVEPETPAEEVPPRDYWIVRGRVTDKSGKGLGGLFVSLYDEDLFFDDRLGQAETDENGKYSLTYRTHEFRDLFERKPDLYLKVIDKKGKSLFVLKGRVWYESGRVETIDIEIDG